MNNKLLLEFANISKKDYNTPVGLWVDEAGNLRQNQQLVTKVIATILIVYVIAFVLFIDAIPFSII